MSQNVYTDAYLYNPAILKEAEAVTQELRASCRKANISSCDHELVIERQLDTNDSSKFQWYYYLVQHDNRIIFWLHERDMQPDLTDVLGETSLPLISAPIHLQPNR